MMNYKDNINLHEVSSYMHSTWEIISFCFFLSSFFERVLQYRLLHLVQVGVRWFVWADELGPKQHVLTHLSHQIET